MLILIPVAAFLLTFLGWGSLHVPEDLNRFLQLSLLVAAVGCAHPLRQVLKRSQPLGWGAKIVVFSLVLALWYTSLVPVLMIANVKLDSSEPKKLERVVLDAEERGETSCRIKVSDWNDNGSQEFHWLYIECPRPHGFIAGTTQVGYEYHKGGFDFPWVSGLAVKK